MGVFPQQREKRLDRTIGVKFSDCNAPRILWRSAQIALPFGFGLEKRVVFDVNEDSFDRDQFWGRGKQRKESLQHKGAPSLLFYDTVEVNVRAADQSHDSCNRMI